MESQKDLQHFLLTRFNILLWKKDKEGCKVRTTKWLKHRFALFEHYCLPSIKKQTCQDFEWIVLFDTMTPDNYKSKIADFQKECPQLIPVFVEPENGYLFAEIFRTEVVKRLKAQRVITTYLDNDDALNLRFVEELQSRVPLVSDGTFFYFDDGYQYYVDDKYMMQIHYPKNHFVSVVEKGGFATVKGIYGYGGHYYIDTIVDVKIVHVRNLLMWCEVVHEKNMINDANFLLRTKIVKDADRLRHDFAVDETVRYGMRIFVFSFLPRYFKTFVRRAKNKWNG